MEKGTADDNDSDSNNHDGEHDDGIGRWSSFSYNNLGCRPETDKSAPADRAPSPGVDIMTSR